MNRNKCKNGNPKKKSRFVCLKCGQVNYVLDGIQRKQQRKYLHVKDCTCLYCKEITKNVEIRPSDWYNDIMEHVSELHEKYYGNEDRKEIKIA